VEAHALVVVQGVHVHIEFVLTSVLMGMSEFRMQKLYEYPRVCDYLGVLDFGTYY